MRQPQSRLVETAPWMVPNIEPGNANRLPLDNNADRFPLTHDLDFLQDIPVGGAPFEASINPGWPNLCALCNGWAYHEAWDSREAPLAFSTAQNVTSDLDPRIQTADHCLGGGGARRNREPGSNSFVPKILTPKPLGLKILQTIFANPAPVAAFKGVGGGGYP
jgi:hypothetical protein